MPCQIASQFILSFKKQSLLKAPLKSNGRVSSYLHPWHRLGFLPGQGCLAYMHKIPRDSPKPLIRDKLICCILLQGHFLNCLLEVDLASKLLSSPARKRAPCSPSAVPHWLLSLEKLHPFMWGCHAQLSQAQPSLWGLSRPPVEAGGLHADAGFPLCATQLRLSTPDSSPARWMKQGPLRSRLLQFCDEGKVRVNFLVLDEIRISSGLCLHKSCLERQLPNLERWGGIKQHIHVLLNDLSMKDTPSSGPSALQHNVINSVCCPESLHS